MAPRKAVPPQPLHQHSVCLLAPEEASEGFTELKWLLIFRIQLALPSLFLYYLLPHGDKTLPACT